jgi:hypothetical protein
VKIEELNAHISALNVENLRLRSSEIALSVQLRREKDKSRSIMADAEAAVCSSVLTHTHLLVPASTFRRTYSIQSSVIDPHRS